MERDRKDLRRDCCTDPWVWIRSREGGWLPGWLWLDRWPCNFVAEQTNCWGGSDCRKQREFPPVCLPGRQKTGVRTRANTETQKRNRVMTVLVELVAGVTSETGYLCSSRFLWTLKINQHSLCCYGTRTERDRSVQIPQSPRLYRVSIGAKSKKGWSCSLSSEAPGTCWQIFNTSFRRGFAYRTLHREEPS